MPNHFPVVGYVGSDPVSRLLIAPALDLGVNLRSLREFDGLNDLKDFARGCSVIAHEENLLPISTLRTLESEGFIFRPSSASLSYAQARNEIHDGRKAAQEFADCVSVLVARSPHQQCSVWTPSQFAAGSALTVTPAPDLSQGLFARAQKIALEMADEMGLAGVMGVEMVVDRGEVKVTNVRVHPTRAGNWTLDGSRTSQFEQHLRGILDLPLGDPTMTSLFAVSATYHLGAHSNMYRPYLHLMARSPGLKFHQYRTEADDSAPGGHVTALGGDLLDLRECVSHAIDYMGGAVDE